MKKLQKIGILSALILGVVPNFSAQQEKSPKLIVGIVVDQMCYDYLYRYQSKFVDGGFKLLMDEGLNCRNTHYNYIPTYTGPGHASIYTGTTPSNHGIVANDWYDRSTNSSINCVDDSTVTSVGTSSKYGQYSPVNLKVNTISDQLKMTYPQAKVISMSIKNRGAILPGGHLSDGSYWFDYETGSFVTSSFFKETLPKWVDAFNRKEYVKEYLKLVWNPLYDLKTYVESGPDNSPYEHLLPGKNAPVFPYDLKAMSGGALNPDLFVHTPYSNTYLTDFAIAAIDPESLGQDQQTDMLCISYSTPDIMGHAFGPYAVEIQDMYLRLDLEMKRLIEALNEKIGEGEYVLFLTADHAVVPVPQYLVDHQLPGGYFFLNERMDALRKSVEAHYGEDLILDQDNLNIYLDHAKMKSRKLSRHEVADFVAERVQEWEGVKRVFTAQQLYKSGIDDEWTEMVRKGYHHAESGDVLFILEAGYLPKGSDSEYARKGTSHGSAFNYDTHVPLIWYGKGIQKGEVFRNIEITDITATLTHLLNVQHPNAVTGKPIIEVLQK